ncbi:LacI family DNA-binding transcriptional regulator [Cohnella faecalis]|uniref:LacI family DNA-binding transcriptional regulator n=1 Tax=Cohnella faecalis TaxID=2315694 RepID=UPI001313DDB0|nr:LacI family DNA-binding transcriptional regulator [Cohnella faecalis]
MNKVTMKDIAREAKVSPATVSYILNNVENQTITDETRCRVLDTAKKLNYIPSLTARSLAKGKSGMLGLLLNRNAQEGFWKQLYYGTLIERMEKNCKKEGYHLLVSGMEADQPNLDIVQQRKMDGVLLVDVKEGVFRNISVHFSIGTPIVLLDSFIEDSLFHKVVFDYRTAFTKWKERTGDTDNGSFLVMESFNNARMVEEIIKASQMESDSIYVLTSDNADGLKPFLELQRGKKGIVINEFIGALVMNASYGLDLEISVICTSNCPEILPPHVHTFLMDADRCPIDISFQILHFYIQSQTVTKDGAYPQTAYSPYVYIPFH